jgi:acyl-CoA thioesterase FadM
VNHPPASAIPAFPQDSPRAAASVHLRFEDVTQDGRLVLESLPNALGPTVWRVLFSHDPVPAAIFAQGIVPILSRLVIEGYSGPVSPNVAIDALGTFRLARTEEGRFLLDMWADLRGVVGRAHGKTERDGERILAGRILAEHVLTRPFGPPEKRRVTSLDFPGAPTNLPVRAPSPSYDAIASVPAGATALEPARSPDVMPIVFGLVHTDGNMHINSLVYLRVFEEAALRRFAALGKGSVLLGRSIDIAYRKPCFAGQTMRVVQQAFEHDGRLGMAAVLVEDHEASSPELLARAKPHAYARMTFER